MNRPRQQPRQVGAIAALLLLASLNVLAGDGGDWRSLLIALLPALLLWGLAIYAAAQGFDLRQCLRAPWQRWPAALYLLLLNGRLLSAGLKLLLYWWPEAPAPWLLLLLISLVTAYGAYQGEAALQRLALLVMAMLFFWAILDTLLLLPQYDLARIAQQAPGQDWLAKGLRESLWLIAPLPALLVYLPSQGPGKRYPAAALGAGLAAAYLLLARCRDQAVLGLLAPLNPYPLVRTLSMVSAGRGLQRVEYFGLLALFAALFSAGMLILGAALSLARGEKGRCPYPAALLWALGQVLAALLFFYFLT